MQRYDDRRIFRRRVAVGQLAEALDLGRLSEPEALRLLARFVFEKLELGGRFDALGENRKSKALSEPEPWSLFEATCALPVSAGVTASAGRCSALSKRSVPSGCCCAAVGSAAV